MPKSHDVWPPKTDALFARERYLLQLSLRSAEAQLDKSIRAISVLALSLVYAAAVFAVRSHAVSMSDGAVLFGISSCVWACLWQIRSIRSGHFQPAASL